MWLQGLIIAQGMLQQEVREDIKLWAATAAEIWLQGLKCWASHFA